MEERKLIRFGKSAYCITIPRTWLAKNHILKGDSLAIHETVHNSIEVMPTNFRTDRVLELSIDISTKSNIEISQLFHSAYLNGYIMITFVGYNAEKIDQIRKLVLEFIAAEIMDISADKVIVTVFWDIKTIELHAIISRICHINKNLLAETIGLIESNTMYVDIVEKGSEVNRQVLLAQRAIAYALNNSATAHKFNLSSLELLGISHVIQFYGKVGEYILKLAKLLAESQYKVKQRNMTITAKKESTTEAGVVFCSATYIPDLKGLLGQISEYFAKVLEIHHKRSGQRKFIYNDYAYLEGALDTFRLQHPQVEVQLVSDYVRTIMLYIKRSEFAMITMETAPK